MDYTVTDTPNILDGIDFTSFWIMWKDNFFQVGKGDVPGQHMFMVFEEYFYFPLISVFVSTGHYTAGKSGIVKIIY